MVMSVGSGKPEPILGRHRAGWKPLVGLDVDGVLYRYGTAIRRIAREEFGVRVSPSVWFTEAAVTSEQWAYFWSDEGVARTFYEGPAFSGAAAFARDLAKIARVRILTAIPDNARDARLRWLAKRKIPYDELVFVPPPASPSAVGTSGRESAKKSSFLPHADVYVDDNVNNAIDLATNTRATIALVDHSWNRDPEDSAAVTIYPQIVRTRTWAEVLAVVKRRLAQGPR